MNLMILGSILCGLALTSVSVGTPRKAAQDPLVEHLLKQINEIPFVDSHTHVPLPAGMAERMKDKSFHYDVPYLIGGASYIASFIYGKDWPEMKERLKVNAQHAYYRPMVMAMRDLYGLGENDELNDSNVEEISRKMDAAHHDPNWYGEVLKRANVRHILWMDWNGKDLQNLPGNKLKDMAFHPLWNVDWVVYFNGQKPKKGELNELDKVKEAFGRKPKNLTELEKLHDDMFKRFLANGGVGLKSTSAYFRALDFDDTVPRSKAEAAFAKVVEQKPLTDKEQKNLQDYLMIRFLKMAAKKNLPFQFHTGNQQNWNIVENSNPLKLNKLLYSGKYAAVKFVLLHGGYPYTQESIMLAKYFPGTVYLDLAWMALFSPAAAKQTLSQALDMLDGTQVMLGTDTANLEELYGTVKITRHILAEVLAEKIESGLWTEEVAMQIARRVLCTNAMELYHLKD
jgi:hypothetical protein